ncbi:thioredoxin domain-containing protein 12-like [Physella acuta]|uniref:thioredoxin domain-containing protein 12-like n=1 Tax=Physella acuta TaxID=109671 RepID=UPI0027DE1C93|nr:thioredoxin domain-containing protein 12-like [Physella acuta]
MADYLISGLASGIRSFFGVTFASGAKSRGWGEQYEWTPLEEAYAKAKAEGKPIFIVVHKMTCSACHAVKTWFSASKRIAGMSKHFVMVNLEYFEVPKGDPDFSPDGFYVPRMLFFSPNGKLMKDAKCGCNPEYEYTYPGEGELLRRMKAVVEDSS